MGNQNQGDFMKNQKSLFMMLLMMQCMYVVAMDKKWQESISDVEIQRIKAQELHRKANELLIEAAGQGDIAQAEQALKLGAEINKECTVNKHDLHSKNTFALYEAVKKNDPVMVEFLLNRGADPTQLKGAGGRPIFSMAVTNRDVRVLKSLLNRLSPLDMRFLLKGELLHEAAEYANVEAIQELLKRGADINLKNKGGYTPLNYLLHTEFIHHQMCWSNSMRDYVKRWKKTLQFLLEQGAEISENSPSVPERVSEIHAHMRQLVKESTKHNSLRDPEYRKEFLSKICNVQ
jgi:hypothetical protein